MFWGQSIGLTPITMPCFKFLFALRTEIWYFISGMRINNKNVKRTATEYCNSANLQKCRDAKLEV